MDLTAGTRIADRYVIERALAKGGMGAVFVARDERMGALVALKITAAGGAAADQLALRFAREARIGHRLGSRRQGFVRASDWGRIDAVQLYLVMDLVDNAKPLDLQQGSLDERVGRWRRAAELVQIAHEHGVIHRDLKPANFLQAQDGAIFLTDFGLAKVVGESEDAPGGQVSLTMTGVGFGTPPYMPPEQLEDAKHADKRADVYALGCMLFEAAVLRLPYPGPMPTSVMGAHLRVRAGSQPAPRPRDVDTSVPAAIDEACVLALELELDRRASSVGALLAVLDGAAVTRVEGPHAPVPSTLSGLATSTPAQTSEPKSPPYGVSPGSTSLGGTESVRPRSPARAIAGVAIAVLAVAGGMFLYERADQRRRALAELEAVIADGVAVRAGEEAEVSRAIKSLTDARDRYRSTLPDDVHRASELLTELEARRQQLEQNARQSALALTAEVESLRLVVRKAQDGLEADLSQARALEGGLEREAAAGLASKALDTSLAAARSERGDLERLRALASEPGVQSAQREAERLWQVGRALLLDGNATDALLNLEQAAATLRGLASWFEAAPRLVREQALLAREARAFSEGLSPTEQVVGELLAAWLSEALAALERGDLAAIGEPLARAREGLAAAPKALAGRRAVGSLRASVGPLRTIEDLSQGLRDADALYDGAERLLSSGDFDGATAAFEQAATALSAVLPRARGLVPDLWARASAAVEADRLGDALALLEVIVTIEPDHVAAVSRRVSVQRDLDRASASREAREREAAAEEAGTEGEAAQDLWLAAADAYDRALALGADDPQIKDARAKALKHGAPARRYLARALELIDEVADPTERYEAAAGVSRSYFQLGDRVRAVEAVRRAQGPQGQALPPTAGLPISRAAEAAGHAGAKDLAVELSSLAMTCAEAITARTDRGMVVIRVAMALHLAEAPGATSRFQEALDLAATANAAVLTSSFLPRLNQAGRRSLYRETILSAFTRFSDKPGDRIALATRCRQDGEVELWSHIMDGLINHPWPLEELEAFGSNGRKAASNWHLVLLELLASDDAARLRRGLDLPLLAAQSITEPKERHRLLVEAAGKFGEPEGIDMTPHELRRAKLLPDLTRLKLCVDGAWEVAKGFVEPEMIQAGLALAKFKHDASLAAVVDRVSSGAAPDRRPWSIGELAFHPGTPHEATSSLLALAVERASRAHGAGSDALAVLHADMHELARRTSRVKVPAHVTASIIRCALDLKRRWVASARTRPATPADLALALTFAETTVRIDPESAPAAIALAEQLIGEQAQATDLQRITRERLDRARVELAWMNLRGRATGLTVNSVREWRNRNKPAPGSESFSESLQVLALLGDEVAMVREAQAMTDAKARSNLLRSTARWLVVLNPADASALAPRETERFESFWADLGRAYLARGDRVNAEAAAIAAVGCLRVSDKWKNAYLVETVAELLTDLGQEPLALSIAVDAGENTLERLAIRSAEKTAEGALKVIERLPRNKASIVEAASLRFRAGDLDGGLAILERLPNDYALRPPLCSALVQEGRETAALRVIAGSRTKRERRDALLEVSTYLLENAEVERALSFTESAGPETRIEVLRQVAMRTQLETFPADELVTATLPWLQTNSQDFVLGGAFTARNEARARTGFTLLIAEPDRLEDAFASAWRFSTQHPVVSPSFAAWLASALEAKLNARSSVAELQIVAACFARAQDFESAVAMQTRAADRASVDHSWFDFVVDPSGYPEGGIFPTLARLTAYRQRTAWTSKWY